MNTLITVNEGDNVITIGLGAGGYRLLAKGYRDATLVDVSFETLPEAVDRLAQFLKDEYAGV